MRRITSRQISLVAASKRAGLLFYSGFMVNRAPPRKRSPLVHASTNAFAIATILPPITGRVGTRAQCVRISSENGCQQVCRHMRRVVLPVVNLSIDINCERLILGVGVQVLNLIIASICFWQMDGVGNRPWSETLRPV